MAGVGEAAAIGVGSHCGLLADAHVAQLGFLQIGVDPHIVQRHYPHQRLAGRHALAELHRAPRHHAADRRRNGGAFIRQIGLAQLGRGQLDRGVVGDDRARGQRFAGGELLLRGFHPGLRGGQRGLGGLQGNLCLPQFLSAHRAGTRQLLAAAQRILRLGYIGLRDADIGLPHGNLGSQGAVVGKAHPHLTHRLRQQGLGLLQRHMGVGAIELHQRLAGLDQLGIVGVDGGHRAAHLRRDLHQIALHIGVIGVGVAQGFPIVIAAIDGADDDEKADGQQHQPPPLGGLAVAISVVVSVAIFGGLGRAFCFVAVWGTHGCTPLGFDSFLEGEVKAWVRRISQEPARASSARCSPRPGRESAPRRRPAPALSSPPRPAAA